MKKKHHPDILHCDIDGTPLNSDGTPYEDPYRKTAFSPAALGALIGGDSANFIVASTPGGIERQEKEGQMAQAKLQTLPRDMGNLRPILEKLGFKFGDFADDLFINVEFPEGWAKKPTDHSMWSDLVDDQGRKRGGIFYKAAFYDRSAHMSMSRRYGVNKDYGDGPEVTSVFILDTATGERLCAKALPAKPGRNATREETLAYYDACDVVEKEVQDELKAKFPNCDDVLAYW